LAPVQIPLWFTKTFTASRDAVATAYIAADNFGFLYVNGQLVIQNAVFQSFSQAFVNINQGSNTVHIYAYNSEYNQGNLAPNPAAVQASIELPADVTGDPQFNGFMGQSYQVHGVSETVYNVISSPSFQYNALFHYLDSGRARRGTLAFSHPGNYFGSVGVNIKDANGAVQQVQISSGAVNTGLTLQINNRTIAVSAEKFQLGAYTISTPSAFEVELQSQEFNVLVQNSDFFLNQAVSIGSDLMQQISEYKRAVKSGAANVQQLKAVLPHGVLGQTWNTQTYQNRWKHIEGQLFDYQLADGLNGVEFKHNRF